MLGPSGPLACGKCGCKADDVALCSACNRSIAIANSHTAVSCPCLAALLYVDLTVMSIVLLLPSAAVQYIDAGSGRQMCNTDLLLRRCGTTDRSEASKLILGVIEVKWQLSLTGSNCLVGALQDPDKGKMAAKVIQQVGLISVFVRYELCLMVNFGDKVSSYYGAKLWRSQPPMCSVCHRPQITFLSVGQLPTWLVKAQCIAHKLVL